MTCSQLSEHTGSEWTSTQPSASIWDDSRSPSWEVFAEQSGLNPLWLLISPAVPLSVCKNGCFSLTSCGHLLMTPTGPLLWIQVCAGVPTHAICSSVHFEVKNQSAVEPFSFSFNYWIFLLGSYVHVRPHISTWKAVTIFICLSNESFWIRSS
jgi:hypothetical protein